MKVKKTRANAVWHIAELVERSQKKYSFTVLEGEDIFISENKLLLSLKKQEFVAYIDKIIKYGYIVSIKIILKKDLSDSQIVQVFDILKRFRHLRSIGIAGPIKKYPPYIGKLKKIKPGVYIRNELLMNKKILSILLSFSLDNLEDLAKCLVDVNLLEYRYLFKSFYNPVRIVLAENPQATLFKEYARLFTDSNEKVLKAVAKNPNACMFKEYARLFPKNKETAHPQGFFFILSIRPYSNVFDSVADNPNACLFKEYARLFDDPDKFVRAAVAKNPNACTFKEYTQLFNDPDWFVRGNVAINPNACRFKEYAQLFKDPNWFVLSAIARNPNACGFKEYAQLFTEKNLDLHYIPFGDNTYRILQSYVYLIGNDKMTKLIAQNRNAPIFKEYAQLFTNPDRLVRMTVASNPNAPIFKEFAQLLTDEDESVKKAASENPNARALK